MRNLLSTKVQRQLRLMETLIQNRNWMKLHEPVSYTHLFINHFLF